MLSFETTLRNAIMDAITSAVGSSGLLKIYSGTVPANVAASLGSATLLATCPLSSAMAAAASGGVLTFNTISPETSCPASGTATFFRVTTSGGTAKFQGTVGTSGADLNLVNVTASSGGAFSIDPGWTLTEGNP